MNSWVTISTFHRTTSLMIFCLAEIQQQRHFRWALIFILSFTQLTDFNRRYERTPWYPGCDCFQLGTFILSPKLRHVSWCAECRCKLRWTEFGPVVRQANLFLLKVQVGLVLGVCSLPFFFISYSEFIEFNHISSHVAWTTSGNSDVFGAIQDPNNNVAIRESPKSLILLNHDRIMDSVCEKCRNASISRFGRFWNFSNMCLIYHWRRTFTSCYSVVRTK